MIEIPYFKQQTDYTCGPASIRMIFSFFGLRLSEKKLARLLKTDKTGTSHEEIIDLARRKRFKVFVKEDSSIKDIKKFIDSGMPVIVNYTEPDNDEGHYSVVIGYTKDKIILNYPWNGERFKIKISEFKKRWYDYRKGHKYNHWMMVLEKR